jgi:putative membrane protein
MRSLKTSQNFRRARVVVTAIGCALMASVALAHGESENSSTPHWWNLWVWEPGMIATLLVTAWIYGRGLHQLRRAIHAPWKMRREAWYYAAGWLALAVAVVSPLHPWGQILFSAHMTQHELLMLVAAPLLVLGRPGPIVLWAMERRAAQRTARWIRLPKVQKLWQAVTRPFVAWLVHAIALWMWHVPALFEATLANAWVHHLQHASFFFSALLFWHAVFHGRQRASGYGAGVLYLFTTALHSGALGALITFAGVVWYPHYLETAKLGGLTPLEDQQLGGLIMWIPAGLVYIVAALVMFAQWLRRSDVSSMHYPSSDGPRALPSR